MLCDFGYNMNWIFLYIKIINKNWLFCYWVKWKVPNCTIFYIKSRVVGGIKTYTSIYLNLNINVRFPKFY